MCPPADAQPVEGPVYRGVRGADPTPQDFQSFNEAKAGAKAEDCLHWGLSVWTTEAAVEHARKIIIPLRKGKWSVVVGHLEPEDGVIKHTPTNDQPDHRTLWRNQQRDLTPKFRLLTPRNSA
jgi:hypothetical protein